MLNHVDGMVGTHVVWPTGFAPLATASGTLMQSLVTETGRSGKGTFSVVDVVGHIAVVAHMESLPKVPLIVWKKDICRSVAISVTNSMALCPVAGLLLLPGSQESLVPGDSHLHKW